jgi:hypothetical protein
VIGLVLLGRGTVDTVPIFRIFLLQDGKILMGKLGMRSPAQWTPDTFGPAAISISKEFGYLKLLEAYLKYLQVALK